MAQITMDSKEYLELVDKSRAWDTLNARLVEETVVDINEDHYNGYHIDLPFSIPEEIKKSIARKVVEELVQSDDVMKKLVADSTTMLNLRSGYIDRNWGYNKPEEVDLMKFPEFKVKYEAIEADLKEEE